VNSDCFFERDLQNDDDYKSTHNKREVEKIMDTEKETKRKE